MKSSTADPTGGVTSTIDPAPGAPTISDILAEHGRWVASGGKEGRSAALAGRDLSGTDLRQGDLRHADLRGVILRGCGLRGCNFSEADLSGAVLDNTDLREANFADADLTAASLVGADLHQAQLRNATLRDADFTSSDLSVTVGLLPGQLGGTVLSGAKLPESFAAFEGLTNVAEASKTTQALFTTTLLVCAYTWLTVASTRDAQLLNNVAPASGRMPILGIELPLVRFYMVAPLLLLTLYIYFHLCLQRVWEELADLPAVFPDGRPLDRKAYPWMMNGLVRSHSPRLRAQRTYLTRWQTRVATAIGWGMVPLTLFATWLRYLRGHDWSLTAIHVGALAASIGVGVGFLRLAAATLRGSEWRPPVWQRAWRNARAFTLVVILGAGLVFWGISLGVIEGVNPFVVWSEDVAQGLQKRYFATDPRRWVPVMFERLGYSPSAVLDDAPLSTKPDNWSPQNPVLESVRGADLEERNLRFAHAYNAFFVNAYLHFADLRWGDFREADLRRADLRDTELAGANFRDAHMAEADLRKAQMQETRFYATELDRAKFKQAALQGAMLEKAKLRGADLTEANLSGAKLIGTDLSPWAEDPARAARPTVLTGAILDGADLSGANLTGADLSKASLREVNLTDAVLIDANLEGADLTGATGLTREQLSSTRGRHAPGRSGRDAAFLAGRPSWAP